MCGKCYPNASNFKCLKIAPQSEKFPDWRILDRISADMYVLCQTQNSHVRYGPLYVHSFVLCAPRKIQEATQFNQRYRSYGTIENVPDRLRWYRHSRGLLQKDVAKLIGISRNMYMNIESGTKKQIPNEIVKKLADFYGVPMEAFMDDYNRFLADDKPTGFENIGRPLG